MVPITFGQTYHIILQKTNKKNKTITKTKVFCVLSELLINRNLCLDNTSWSLCKIMYTISLSLAQPENVQYVI